MSRFRSLLEHPGWVDLVRIGNAQALNREGKVLRNPTSPEELGEHNFMKGEAMGLRALIAIPSTFIEAHKDDDKEPEGEIKS